MGRRGAGRRGAVWLALLRAAGAGITCTMDSLGCPAHSSAEAAWARLAPCTGPNASVLLAAACGGAGVDRAAARVDAPLRFYFDPASGCPLCACDDGFACAGADCACDANATGGGCAAAAAARPLVALSFDDIMLTIDAIHHRITALERRLGTLESDSAHAFFLQRSIDHLSAARKRLMRHPRPPR